MSFINNWCERLFLISVITLIIIISADYKFYFLPIHGLWLLLYVFLVIIITIWLTVLNIQKLLQKTAPFEYKIQSNKLLLRLFNFDANKLLETSIKDELKKDKSIDERIESLIFDIEKKFISKWYNLISNEGTFPAESKILIEGIIRRMLQVSVQIDSCKLACGILTIILKHLKENRKAIKRVEKSRSSIENAYRYSHIGHKNQAAFEHFIHKLTTNVLREFISWELWNSLPCRLLVSVLSKKLTTYFIFYVSQPGWLNYRLSYYCATKSDLIKYNLDKYSYISLSDVDLSENDEKIVENEPIDKIVKSVSCTPDMSPKKDLNLDTMIKNDSESIIEQALTKMISQQTATILQRAEKSSIVETIPESNDLHKRSEPVKIHSAKSSSKKWDDADMCNVSLGQDLLAIDAMNSELQGFSGRRLWGYNADLNNELGKENIIWGTEENDELNKPGNVTATTLHNMRELQNNVVRPVSHATEKAIHKIGDLQDEAVGVVEGIFDFGMAGIRKGLRLTGLQEHNVPKLVKLGHVASTTAENVWINPLAKEESPTGFENQILLEKSPNLSDEQITNLYLTDSPEYEETADLASTISKLRSLLQQKSSESSLNTPAVSPMLLDDKTCSTPIEQIGEICKGDGGMQRFARTVTGMFNTFKTALPGSIAEQSKTNVGHWIFVENETSETDLSSLLHSLLVERRDYCTVDTAYEAMDSLDLLTESVNSQISKIQWEDYTYEDELDDYDTAIPITRILFDIICECLQDTNCALNQEPVLKAVLILIGAKSEDILMQRAEKILRSINKIIDSLPKGLNDNVMALKLDEMADIIQNSLPYLVKEIFGKEDFRTCIKFIISSLQNPKMNQDVMLQIFQLICSHLIFTSSQMSPTPSA